MPSNEAGVVRDIFKAVQREYPDSWAFKVVGGPYQTAGIPDILFCIYGLLVAMEVKHQRPGESEEAARGRATLQQRAQIQKINKAGGIAAVVLSDYEALDLIERGIRKHRERRN